MLLRFQKLYFDLQNCTIICQTRNFAFFFLVFFYFFLTLTTNYVRFKLYIFFLSRFNHQHIISHFTPTFLLLILVIAHSSIHTITAKSVDNDPTTATTTKNNGDQTKTTTNTTTTIFFDNFQFEVATAPNTSTITAVKDKDDVLPTILKISTIPRDYADSQSRHSGNILADHHQRDTVSERRKVTKMRSALDQAAKHGLQEMMEMFSVKEPDLIRKGKFNRSFF